MEHTLARRVRAATVALTPCDGALFLFILTAAVGVALAYNQPVAWRKFGLIVLGALLYTLFSRLPERHRFGNSLEVAPLALALVALELAVAIDFFLTNDWVGRAGKLALLAPAMRWLAEWQSAWMRHVLDSNAAGGVFAMLIPLHVAVLAQLHSLGAKRGVMGGFLLLAALCIGLLLSASRGAWLALVLIAVAWGVWRLIRRLAGRWAFSARLTRVGAAGAVLILLLAGGTALIFTPLAAELLELRPDREVVWRNSVDLLKDYPLTGVGLGNVEMAQSTYVLLLHVGYTSHAHNLFLDVWLEQGLLGLSAFAVLVALAVRSESSSKAWRIAGIASLGVILAHGLVDDPFYGYGGWAAPLLFVPLGVLARAQPGWLIARVSLAHGRRVRVVALLAGLSIAAIGLAVSLVPALQATIRSNLGALVQTRRELSNYAWPAAPSQDVIRRAAQADLGLAKALFDAALAVDPSNAPANRRLGQMELAWGQYDVAHRHLLAAYATAPEQRATRQLLGESYALAGNIAGAVALWRSIDVSQGQLDLRVWWYEEYLGDGERAANMARAVQVFKEP